MLDLSEYTKATTLPPLLPETSQEAVMFNTRLLQALTRAKPNADAAFEVWEEMKQAGVKPDLVSYNFLLRACHLGGRAADALDLFKEMLDAGIAPSRVTYSHMIMV